MNTEETRKRRHRIADRAAAIAALDYRTLYRVEELGLEAGFSVGADVFERIWTFLRQITFDSLLVLPVEALDATEQFLQQTEEALGRIRSFRLSQGGELMRIRDSYLGQLDEYYRDLFKYQPTVALIAYKAQSTGAELKERQDALAQLQQLADKGKEEIERQKVEAEDLLAKMRQASGKIALQSYSSFFLQEARQAKTMAYIWLAVTIVPAGFLVGYLVWLVFWWAKVVPDYSMIQALQVGGAKLALFTVGFYLVSWCGRNFKAQWHIHVVNSHRSNTLNALEAFANSAKNDATREAVLIHASSAIFAQVHTGFVPDQSDAPSTPAILEIVRGAKSD